MNEIVKKELLLPNLKLHNRLVLPPMATSSADEEGKVTDKILDYYNDKSHGGYLSLIITEHSYISEEGKANSGQMSVSRDDDVEGLKRLAEVVHKNGSKVIAQISHAGAAASKKVTGRDAVAPSLNTELVDLKADHELTEDEIKLLIEKFTDAAGRVIKAGFDGVEIHSAHRYLLNQFYSPLSNKRKDKYGGDLEGRIRLHMEIIGAVRAVIGSKNTLALRLGACDYMDGGNQIDDAVKASEKFVQAGIDLLDISGGMCGFMVWGREKEQGYFSDVTEAIKKRVSAPILLTGGITQIESANRLLEEKKADLIGIGRAMFKDSLWAEKALKGEAVNE